NASSHGEVFLRQRTGSNEFDLGFELACARSTLVDGDLATFTFLPTEDTLTSIVEGETVTFRRTTFRSNEKRYSYTSSSINISFRLLDDEFGVLEVGLTMGAIRSNIGLSAVTDLTTTPILA
ncbi:hypothetical protein FOZ63_000690, partial [Perkinsus olseni]